MPEQHDHISRRTFLSANAKLLAGFGLSMALPGAAQASTAQASTGQASSTAGTSARTGPSGRPADADLALYRPVTVSSTAYGPTPRSSRSIGWPSGGPGHRMAGRAGDPQWIAVDLQAPCEIESVVLVFEATASDPAWVPAQGSNPYVNTTGWEIMSSCATAFQLDVSTDGSTWSTVYQTTSGTGGDMRIPLAKPVDARGGCA